MAHAVISLPADADLGLRPERQGPVQAADFEHWPQEPEHPMELIGGWVVPLSPIGFTLGRKFLAYEMIGVQEYFYTWPEGREASGFRLRNRVYVQLEADDEGFFPSRVLGARPRLVPAALNPE
jgi:hypothetical protein